MAWKWSAYRLKKGKRSRIFDRVFLFQLFIVLAAGGLGARLFYLQVLSYDDFREQANDEHRLYTKLMPKRGEIFVQEAHVTPERASMLSEVGGGRFFPAVTNRDYLLVYAIPKEI